MEGIIISFLSEEELGSIHKLSSHSYEMLGDAETIGCFSCTQIIDFKEIDEVIEYKDQSIAICPNCSVDALIPLDEFDSSDHRVILNQMRFKYFGQSILLRKSEKIKGKRKEIYLYQEENIYLMDLIQELDTKLATTNRLIEKNIYQEYDNAIRYSIPFKNEDILLYAIDDAFVNRILQNIYHAIDFPLAYRKVLTEIIENPERPSFIIVLPESLSEKEAQYVVKLLGIVFGGYFSRLSDVPANGQLNQAEHIFIESFQGEAEDIIDNLEGLLKKYS